MSRISPVSWQRFEKFLEINGCLFIRQTGSHRIYRKAGLKRSIVLPAHTKEIPVFVIKANIRTLNVTGEDYVQSMRKIK